MAQIRTHNPPMIKGKVHSHMDMFLSMSSREARASRDHFFCLRTFMNCAIATMTICLLQKLGGGGQC